MGNNKDYWAKAKLWAKALMFPGIMSFILLLAKIFGEKISWFLVFAPVGIFIAFIFLLAVVVSIKTLVQEEKERSEKVQSMRKSHRQSGRASLRTWETKKKK